MNYLENRARVRVTEAWFFACAIRHAQRFLLSRRMTETIPADMPVPETGWEQRFISRQLLLPRRANSRTLLGRLFIAGFSAREIAAADHCTPRSVEPHAAKLLNKLRARITTENQPLARQNFPKTHENKSNSSD